jgi:hypothetical protein
MAKRYFIILFFISTVVVLVSTSLQSVPGYMDAEYYFMGGQRLAQGYGFSEPILWNYLDDPKGLPHPSHSYWMPLASIVSATGMYLFGNSTFLAARFVFILLAMFVPLVSAALAYQISGNHRWAILSGFLVIFSGFYLPFITTTDTFTINMFLGGVLFLLIGKVNTSTPFVLFSIGLVSGLFHLLRADGFIWLPVIIFFFVLNREVHLNFSERIINLVLILGGYLVIIGPWIARNQMVFGTLLAPGGTRSLWLTDYDQLFSFPADQLTFHHWWESGVPAILQARLWAFGTNVQRAIAETGLIFLTPLVILGMWRSRKDLMVRVGFWAWLLIFGLMTAVFPFSGARGGLFHSCSALLPLFWALAPLGLESFVEWGGRHRGWIPSKASLVFSSALVIFAVILSIVIYVERVFGPDPSSPSWEKTSAQYQIVEAELRGLGASPDEIVMVKDPPGYYLASGRKAIVIPDGDIHTLLLAAWRYKGRYVILEIDHTQGLDQLYQAPNIIIPGLALLKYVQDTYIFEIK